MLRRLHSLPGLVSALLVALVGLTGAVLSVDPALERLGTSLPAGLSVAELAGRVARHYPGAEQIQRTPSGAIIVYYSSGEVSGAARVDPASGAGLAPYAPSAFSRWVKELHRSLFLDTAGSAATGLTALTMLLLSASGIALLLKRVGGWRRLARPLHGSRSQRWHAAVARLAAAGLLLSALTGSYMSAATFALVPDGTRDEPDFPATTSGGAPLPAARLPALLATELADLRELVFPLPGDRSAVYTLRTARGDAYVDQSSGALLAYRAHSGAREVYELVYQLHTGEGMWWLGLLLGLSALGAPWLAATGATVWWQRRRAKPRIAGNAPLRAADTVILVGSENNSTWGFARALHDALTTAGRRVHTAPMNQFSSRHGAARHLFLLTATYGDGDAPASASQFLARLAAAAPNPAASFAVLGFGDRQFPQFCQFALDVDAALAARGWRRLCAPATIDRQSTQEFARWGTAVGALLGHPLVLEHAPAHPATTALQLRERVDYGREQQEPTVVLRFVAAPAPAPGWLDGLLARRRLPRFEAGDLAGIIAPGSPMPRFYSLASGSNDGVLEICVRKQPAGLCSSYLHGLRPGDRVEAFIQPNPRFRPTSGKAPVILIGAGTGIGPLAGFIRNNSGKHPMYLYWGGRDPDSDFLYEPELRDYLADRRLTQLHTAFSRIKDGVHVQNRLSEDADNMRRLIEDDGQVLVCGSRAMADSVRQALDQILAPLNLTVQALRDDGRYREDVF
ncbi:PepSY domain-containing protein [Rugamonas rubra]|uniref:Sulfite reductase (NADPH) flavoprotein alpha-component n=1 Tax=Rugamonas rubra TaxID=758825 RepID=A0A1I4P183_9BURK|nr:PepSY domain-containing protein [Rugamonas rubra]SFM21561.1 sulfite reductase (NADPH) flavoprotein alpha-component [Rugamonas rubra]